MLGGQLWLTRDAAEMPNTASMNTPKRPARSAARSFVSLAVVELMSTKAGNMSRIICIVRLAGLTLKNSVRNIFKKGRTGLRNQARTPFFIACGRNKAPAMRCGWPDRAAT